MMFLKRFFVGIVDDVAMFSDTLSEARPKNTHG